MYRLLAVFAAVVACLPLSVEAQQQVPLTQHFEDEFIPDFDDVRISENIIDLWGSSWTTTDSAVLESAWCGYGPMKKFGPDLTAIVARIKPLKVSRHATNTTQVDQNAACPPNIGPFPFLAVIHTHPGPRQLVRALPDSLAAKALLYRARHYNSGFECDLSDQDRSTQSKSSIPIMIVVCVEDTYAWLDLYGARHEEAANVVGGLADRSEWVAPHSGMIADTTVIEGNKTQSQQKSGGH